MLKGSKKIQERNRTMSILTEQPDKMTLTAGPEELNQVMVELDELKRQSERLDLINRLHGRMSGVLSMASMIEVYSVWLMPIVEHELIGYNTSFFLKPVYFMKKYLRIRDGIHVGFYLSIADVV